MQLFLQMLVAPPDYSVGHHVSHLLRSFTMVENPLQNFGRHGPNDTVHHDHVGRKHALKDQKPRFCELEFELKIGGSLCRGSLKSQNRCSLVPSVLGIKSHSRAFINRREYPLAWSIPLLSLRAQKQQTVFSVAMIRSTDILCILYAVEILLLGSYTASLLSQMTSQKM